MRKTGYIILFLSIAVLGLMLSREVKFSHEIPEMFTREKCDNEKIHESGGEVEEENEDEYDNPGQFAEYYRVTRTRIGESVPGYKPGYQVKEYQKALNRAPLAQLRKQSYNWKERGPANVPGRTRGLLVMPGDPTHNTFIAGSVGGGIWKSTDGGQTWVNKTPDKPNLATTSLAYADSNPDIIYAGTGESFGSAGLIEIAGQGMYKSTDGGDTWNLIPATVDVFNFLAINRIIVDPDNPDILLISANQNSERGISFKSGIYKSTDGGNTWTKVYDPSAWVTQIIYQPGNFNIQYAAEYGIGVAKSTDAGNTWKEVSNGMFPTGRVELAISPLNHNRMYATAEGGLSGVNSDLYISEDSGINWNLVVERNNQANRDFFSASASAPSPQGLWDNTISVNPFYDSIAYLGGIDIWKIQLTPGTVYGDRTFAGVKDVGVNKFMSFVNFNSGSYWGNKLAVGTIDTSRFVSVEIRFGLGIHQKAHRFTIPTDGGTNNDGGAGIPDNEYMYADYVDVPFQAWDIKNNRQLMVSFRDQADNGIFDLLPQKTSGNYKDQSREYFYIHDITYDPNAPSDTIARNGGQVSNMMYFMWPYLADGATWDPTNLPDAKLQINWDNLVKKQRITTRMTSWSGTGTENGRVLPYVHADQHKLIPVITNTSQKVFKIVNANDGGVFQSVPGTDPGLGKNDWIFAGNGFNCTQFYGIDKKPGADAYVGGVMDNGSYISPTDSTASSVTKYKRVASGDGFETSWNYDNKQEVIVSTYNNNFVKTTDGGATWVTATRGLTDINTNAPFISRIASSKSQPDVLYTVGYSGVWRSTDFGDSWNLTPINSGWNPSISLNVKVSLADYNIVWAGEEMSDSGRVFVSTDAGRIFRAVSNYTKVKLGNISGLATHPYQDSTAYVLFSFAGAPKILRTEDLGQTWEDISGFGTNSLSSNGFPDVAVHCLIVLPDNPDILWAGTEIGIFQSNDNGKTWSILNNGFPAVSVWDMKAVDNQIVIATHGRGIWTATLTDLPKIVFAPKIIGTGVSYDGKLAVEAGLRSDYDSTVLAVNGIDVMKLPATPVTDSLLSIKYIGLEGNITASLTAYKDGKAYNSVEYKGYYFTPKAVADNYGTTFSENYAQTDFIGNGLEIQTPAGFSESLHSPHPYDQDTTYEITLRTPIRVSSSMSSMFYDDIAIVEPGDAGTSFGEQNFNDYVVVEGSSDGINWKPLAPGYDADANADWLDAYDNKLDGTGKMYKSESIDLQKTFRPGDIIFIRFRMYSDNLVTSWGWAIDNLYIQQERPLALVRPEPVVNKFVVYPNPFSQYAHIEFTTLRAGNTALEIIDTQGKKVAAFPMGSLMKGKHDFDWDTADLPKGLYIARIYNNGTYTTVKMIKN